METPGLILALVASIMVLKTIVLYFLARIFKTGTDQGLVFAVALSQVGEFAFVLLSFARQQNIVDDKMTGMMMAVIALTMALTPLLIILNEKLILPHFGIEEAEEQKEPDKIEEKSPVIIAGFGRYGDIVGRFLKANGIVPTILEIDSDRVELLRKLGLKAYYGDATRDAPAEGWPGQMRQNSSLLPFIVLKSALNWWERLKSIFSICMYLSVHRIGRMPMS